MSKTLHDVLDLVQRINDETERAAFMYVMGHIGTINIKVAEGKEGDTKDEDGFRIKKYNANLYSDMCIDVSNFESINKVCQRLEEFLGDKDE